MLKQIEIPGIADGGPAAGTRLSGYLADAGYAFATPCGGIGTCGKCRVTLLSGTVYVGDTAVTAACPTEVLACETVLSGDACTVLVPLTEGEGLTAHDAVTHHGNRNAETDEGTVGLALDIGTTTLALALVAGDGNVLASVSRLNPQMSYGADVMSRIGAVMADERALAEMQSLLCAAIAEMITSLTGDTAVPAHMTVVGNTTMLHIFCGISPAGMGAYPFTPIFTDEKIMVGEPLGLPVAEITVLPSVSAFVGSDILAGVLASGMTAEERITALIDIGTNGEMVLSVHGRYYGTSTAAGPALEGAGISTGIGGVRGAVSEVQLPGGNAVYVRTIGDDAPVGICGSGLISLIAALLDAGIVDETGYMEDGAFVYAKTATGTALSVTDGDIRAFQLAKSAIRAGFEALCRAAGITPADVDRLYLAGGLGYYMNIPAAMRVGLLPRLSHSRVKSIGNAALAGACRCLVDAEEIGTLRRIADQISIVDLNASDDFRDGFMEYMMFPEDGDA